MNRRTGMRHVPLAKTLTVFAAVAIGLTAGSGLTPRPERTIQMLTDCEPGEVCKAPNPIPGCSFQSGWLDPRPSTDPLDPGGRPPSCIIELSCQGSRYLLPATIDREDPCAPPNAFCEEPHQRVSGSPPDLPPPENCFHFLGSDS